jgi:hypothetical protein
MNYLVFDVVSLAHFLGILYSWTTTVYGFNLLNCISLAQFTILNYRLNFQNKKVFYLSNGLRRMFQPFFGGNKIHITQNVGKNLYFYDINSLYPYLMLRGLPNDYSPITTKEDLNFFFGFIGVTLLKKPKNKFFTDFFRGIMFSEEVKMLIKMGHLFKFHYFIKFKQEKLFCTYVKHFYHIKRYTKSDLLKYLSKVCLNSLYGKFATQISRINSLQISMAVNSYARVEMLQYKQKYFIYADTDSIIYEQLLSRLFVGPDIGLMKLVDFIDEGYFLPNYYMYTSKKKIVIKARGIIKKVMPKLRGLYFDFKLLYFKKRQYTVYLTETLFKFNYTPNNAIFYDKVQTTHGSD